MENMPFLDWNDMAAANDMGGTKLDKMNSPKSIVSNCSSVIPNARAVAMMDPTEQP